MCDENVSPKYRDDWLAMRRRAEKAESQAALGRMIARRFCKDVDYWRERVEKAEAALAGVEALAGQWAADPGDGHGLRWGQISQGAAAYWVREALRGPDA